MIPFDNWGGIDQDAMRRLALDPTTQPMIYRIMFAALAWANVSGHAEMEPGELARHLQVVSSGTGELVVPSSSWLSNEIRRARERGLIGDGSGVRCLVAPEWFVRAGGRGGYACKVHGIRGRRSR